MPAKSHLGPPRSTARGRERCRVVRVTHYAPNAPMLRGVISGQIPGKFKLFFKTEIISFFDFHNQGNNVLLTIIKREKKILAMTNIFSIELKRRL